MSTEIFRMSDQRRQPEESGKNGIVAGTGPCGEKRKRGMAAPQPEKRVVLWLREVKNVVCGGGKSCCGIYRKGKGKGKNFWWPTWSGWRRRRLMRVQGTKATRKPTSRKMAGHAAGGKVRKKVAGRAGYGGAYIKNPGFSSGVFYFFV